MQSGLWECTSHQEPPWSAQQKTVIVQKKPLEMMVFNNTANVVSRRPFRGLGCTGTKDSGT